MSEKGGIEAVVGIDIAKERFSVALLRGGKYKHRSFANNAEGFSALSKWLQRQGVEDVGGVHACMESTGMYGEPLAQYLYDNGYRVSVVNPARVKGFAQGELIRTKTDKVDASVIARFSLAMRPEGWVPEAKEIRELRSLVRRVDALIKMRNQESNRLEARDDVVREEIEDHIEYLDKQIEGIKQRIKGHIDGHPQLRDKRDLLESIPGVGEATIGLVLSHFAHVRSLAVQRSWHRSWE